VIERTLSRKLSSLAKEFPVVTMTGPRQSGKTTLVKALFPEHDYVNLEDPDDREFALSDPRGFLRRFQDGLIIDEVQKVPALLSYIQGIVDGDGKPGHFILTGSQQFQMMEKVSQTLAGRTAVIHLFPFTLVELMGIPHTNPWDIATPVEIPPKPPFNMEDILFQGFYPPIHDRGLNTRDWLSGYYQAYVERDVREVSNIGSLDAFQRFVRLCAGRSGQLLNLSSLASDAGISHATARQWISILQAGFIIHLLQPHHENFSKRIVKNSKLYFLDTGLLCYLLHIRTPGDILSHGLRGAIFETFVVAELYKAFYHTGERPPLYFWRDRTGHEVDVVIDHGTGLIPVEIKSGETVSSSFFDGLRYFTALRPSVMQTGILIYGGDQSYRREDFLIRPWYRCI
jgi:predicted AAA+ superfamily ATPase